MIRSVVALGGPPGSGKSTAGKLAATELGLEYRSVGEVFRSEASRRGLSLEEFGRFAESHTEVDRELDRRMEELARPGVMLEGRIQGPLCRRRGVPVIVVTVTASEAERARRLAERDRLAVPEALRALRVREASERTRYREIYGIDLDQEPTDLRVDSTALAPPEVARRIVAFVRGRETSGGA